MANIDEVVRRCMLEEWIDELQLTISYIDMFSVDNTGLCSVRKAIIDKLDEIVAYAESKKPGFDPFAVVAAQKAQIEPLILERLARGRRRNDG